MWLSLCLCVANIYRISGGCCFQLFSFHLLHPQLPRNRAPLVTDIPDLGVVSTHQKDDCLSLNDEQHQQDTTCSISHRNTFWPSCDTNGKGIQVYVHSEDGFSRHGEESEEEVMLHPDYFAPQLSLFVHNIQHNAWPSLSPSFLFKMIVCFFLSGWMHSCSTSCPFINVHRNQTEGMSWMLPRCNLLYNLRYKSKP